MCDRIWSANTLFAFCQKIDGGQKINFNFHIKMRISSEKYWYIYFC